MGRHKKSGRRKNSGSDNKALSPTQTQALKKLKQLNIEQDSDTESVHTDADDFGNQIPVSTEKMADGPSESNEPGDLSSEVKNLLLDALKDKEIVASIAKAIKEEVKRSFEEERNELRAEIKARDDVIVGLEAIIDALEMYGRRNGVRIFGIEESEGENTDKIVLDTAKKVGADIPTFALGRSHRVGRAHGDRPRAIIAKFISHNYKVELLKNKSKLKKKCKDVFINEDLTQRRMRWAQRARTLRKEGKIQDTWTRDGVIFIKYKDIKENDKIVESGAVDRVEDEDTLTKIELSFLLKMRIPKEVVSASE